jgi:hypothetical protein
MHYSEEPLPPRRLDGELLAEFGFPVYELVSQPRLQPIGWGSMGVNGTTLEVSIQYWAADEGGDFHFTTWPMGEFGVFLRGSVFTEVLQSPIAAGDPERSALTGHLGYVVTNDRINRPDFGLDLGTPDGQAALDEWHDDIEVLVPWQSELIVDDRSYPAVAISFDGYTARVIRLRERLVTLVINDEDARTLDTRLVSRNE